MKNAVFIILGYIFCTLKCEMNITEDVTNSETLVSPEVTDLLITLGAESVVAGEQPEILSFLQQITTSKPPVDVTDGREPPDNVVQPFVVEPVGVVKVTPADTIELTEAGQQPDIIKQQEVITLIPAVDTTDIQRPLDNLEQPVDAKLISDSIVANNTTIVGEQPDFIKQTEVAIITPSSDTTDADEQPDNMHQPTVGKITSAANITGVVGEADYLNKQENKENVEAKEKQVIQADNAGPSKIKVEDALKLLEKSKKLYSVESIALIKRLEWLRSRFNVTEIELEHKIDPKSFDYLSDTGNGTSNVPRRYLLKDLDTNENFVLLKEGILKERGKALKQKFYRPSKTDEVK